MRTKRGVLLTLLSMLCLSFTTQPIVLQAEESLAERIAAIGAEYEKHQSAFYEELRAIGKLSKSLEREEYRKRISEANSRFNEYRGPTAAKLAELLKANASDPAVVDGILLYSGPMSHSIGIVPEFKTMLLGQQFANPAIGKLCYKFRYNNNDADAQAILAAAAERHPSADVRGIATYSLGEYYRQTARTEWGRELSETERDRLLQLSANNFKEVLDKYTGVKTPDGKSVMGTLATVSLSRVKNIPNLLPGRPAPQFAGTDLNEAVVKLSDFRGKVVVLVYWGSWCGPCMAQVPHERELVERMNGKPFVLVGVNCGDTLEKARQTAEERRMSWISLWDGGTNDGPLQASYNVLHWPTVYVIDDKGTIQHIDIHGEQLDAAVDKLVSEIDPTK
ncbi:redoxin domain-containing protein [Anatilimnocola sp. NA78]|uniref:TlpA family protein disulfide reductase n=1 Tax=Anatilimnocola sp. NA78 TaxID=3415683 RepID=UPI003CE47EEB